MDYKQINVIQIAPNQPVPGCDSNTNVIILNHTQSKEGSVMKPTLVNELGTNHTLMMASSFPSKIVPSAGSLEMPIYELGKLATVYTVCSASQGSVNAVSLDNGQVSLDTNSHINTADVNLASLSSKPIPANPYHTIQNQSYLKEPICDDPLYVNAKQYHRILKRREARAKLEAKGKIQRERKKYQYESRHKHAVGRARSTTGQFLQSRRLISKNSSVRGKENKRAKFQLTMPNKKQ